MTESTIAGGEIVAALKKARIEFIACVPDAVTSRGLLWPIARGQDFKLVRLCKEDEGVSVCSGLALVGRRAALMMQMTGMLDSLNAIRGIACELEQPVCMIVGLLAKERGMAPTKSASYGVRIVEPILDAMGIPHFCIEGPREIAMLPEAIDLAYTRSRPMVAFVGQVVTP